MRDTIYNVCRCAEGGNRAGRAAEEGSIAAEEIRPQTASYGTDCSVQSGSGSRRVVPAVKAELVEFPSNSIYWLAKQCLRVAWCCVPFFESKVCELGMCPQYIKREFLCVAQRDQLSRLEVDILC